MTIDLCTVMMTQDSCSFAIASVFELWAVTFTNGNGDVLELDSEGSQFIFVLLTFECTSVFIHVWSYSMFDCQNLM